MLEKKHFLNNFLNLERFNESLNENAKKIINSFFN